MSRLVRFQSIPISEFREWYVRLALIPIRYRSDIVLQGEGSIHRLIRIPVCWQETSLPLVSVAHCIL